GIPIRREHEVLHNQLWPADAETSEPYLAVRPVEHIVLVDQHPGQRAPLLGKPVAGAREFLLAHHVGLAGFDPFLTRDDAVRLHSVPPKFRREDFPAERKGRSSPWHGRRAPARRRTVRA